MDISSFIGLFLDQFDEEQQGDVDDKTVFRELNGWSSLVALSLMAMIDEEYDVQVTGEDIRNAKTIGDLFRIVNERTKSCS